MDPKKRAAIVGVTGFIGRGLPALLAENGMAVTGISRAGKGVMPDVDRWQAAATPDFSGHHAVINLAGEAIDKRWSDANRRKFHESRVGVTSRIVEAIARLPEGERPAVLVNASAVGIYGDRGDDLLADNARPGRGYLADLCIDWEDAAKYAETLGVRVVRLRIGVVLGQDGPAFRKLRLVFGLGIGGPLGSGLQWMPWIHVADLRAAIVHCVLSENLSGPVNACAPNPERNSDFTKKLAKALHRPAFIAVPGFALKLALDGFGAALLQSQRATPSALLANGFDFRYPLLEDALKALV